MIIEEKQNMSELEKMAVRNGNFQFLLLACHPVGSLYWSSDPTDPSELFGGEWKQIKDTFILAAGDTYKTVDDTVRGEATHTLTENEMPSHSHKLGTSTSGEIKIDGHLQQGSYTKTGEGGTGKSGGGQPHNNMPPYITRYCWERTA